MLAVAKIYDHVAAFSFSLANHLTQLCRSARLLTDLVNRRQQARPGDSTGVDGVAHVLVNRRAEALNRRESGLDCG